LVRDLVFEDPVWLSRGAPRAPEALTLPPGMKQPTARERSLNSAVL
jgi:hypothetical protein